MFEQNLKKFHHIQRKWKAIENLKICIDHDCTCNLITFAIQHIYVLINIKIDLQNITLKCNIIKTLIPY